MRRVVALLAALALLPAATAEADVTLGIAADPSKFATIEEQIHVDLRMTYSAWGSDTMPTLALYKNRALGYSSSMISWEPWKPTPFGTPSDSGPPSFRNRAIAAGQFDAYVRRFAREVAGSGGVVYIRYAHEMNGNWMPWSHDPAAYVRAWRHVWRIFRQERADNVRWVWSVNPNTYQGDAAFTSALQRWWPGAKYVDFVGASLVRFADQPAARNVSWFLDRIDMLRRYGKPVILTETKVFREERYRWLSRLRCGLAKRPWIPMVVWSETRSRAQALRWVGQMEWSVADDPRARLLLAALRRPAC
jgi:beta-mannanase